MLGFAHRMLQGLTGNSHRDIAIGRLLRWSPAIRVIPYTCSGETTLVLCAVGLTVSNKLRLTSTTAGEQLSLLWLLWRRGFIRMAGGSLAEGVHSTRTSVLHLRFIPRLGRGLARCK